MCKGVKNLFIAHVILNRYMVINIPQLHGFLFFHNYYIFIAICIFNIFIKHYISNIKVCMYMSPPYLTN